MTTKITNNNGIITTGTFKSISDPRGVGYLFYKHLKEHKDKVFQIDAITGEEQTYAKALQLTIRIALKLLSFGITADDTISVCSENSLYGFLPVIASFFIGAKNSNFNPGFEFDELTDAVESSDAKVIFVQEKSVDKIEKVVSKTNKNIMIVVFGNSSKHVPFSEFIQSCKNENYFVPAVCHDSKIAIITMSSGTTGVPKGICVSHQAYQSRISFAISLGNFYERILNCSPLNLATTFVHWGVTIIQGSVQIVLPIFNCSLFCSGVNKYKPTFSIITNYQLLILFNSSSLTSLDTSCFKRVFGCGGQIFQHQIIAYKQKFPSIGNTYGLAEAGTLGFFTVNTKKDQEFFEKKITSIGSMLNGISYKVVNLETEELVGPHHQGELRVKSGNLFSGYTKEVANIWDSDGWFKTGDLVYYDDDFYLYFVDRIKELIKFRDDYVSPKIIENLITSHPEISNACVIGIPHQKDGNHIMALLECKNYSANIEEEILHCVENQLEDKYKLRGGVKVFEKLPSMSTGKPTFGSSAPQCNLVEENKNPSITFDVEVGEGVSWTGPQPHPICEQINCVYLRLDW